MQLQLTEQDPVADPFTDGFGHWLAGFIDGEGCFAICRRQRAGYVTYQPMMKLVLRADDTDVVYLMAERTGLGGVFTPAGRVRGNQKPQVGWLISSKGDCLGLIALLDQYPLRAKKARDYAIWREAINYWASRQWYVGGNRGPRDWSRMEQYATALQEVRRWKET